MSGQPATEISLRPLIDSAVAALSGARTSAQVLEARHKATAAYDAAKSAMRLAKAVKAADDIFERVRCAQGDALKIEVAAKIRLADEYDAAQDSGQAIGPKGGRPPKTLSGGSGFSKRDAGLNDSQIHEARQLRDAEQQQPGTIEKAIDQKIENKEEPTRAHVREVINEVVFGKDKKEDKKNPHFKPDPIGDARRRVVSSCRGILEILREYRAKDLFDTFLDEGDKERGMEDIKIARDALTWFMKENGYEK